MTGTKRLIHKTRRRRGRKGVDGKGREKRRWIRRSKGGSQFELYLRNRTERCGDRDIKMRRRPRTRMGKGKGKENEKVVSGMRENNLATGEEQGDLKEGGGRRRGGRQE